MCVCATDTHTPTYSPGSVVLSFDSLTVRVRDHTALTTKFSKKKIWCYQIQHRKKNLNNEQNSYFHLRLYYVLFTDVVCLHGYTYTDARP